MTKNNSEVVIQVHGKPKAIVMSFREYKKVQQLKEQERRRISWEELEALRRKVSARFADVPEENRYRIAGMSESVIREIIEKDAELVRKLKRST